MTFVDASVSGLHRIRKMRSGIAILICASTVFLASLLIIAWIYVLFITVLFVRYMACLTSMLLIYVNMSLYVRSLLVYIWHHITVSSCCAS